jgi:acyl transferase domain-containing protein
MSMDHQAADRDGLSPTKRALLAVQELRARLDARGRGSAEPIALVGMSCRLPGAPGLDAFWKLLREGGDAITEVPPERWSLDRLYHPDPAVRGRVSSRYGGFLAGLERFDAAFFEISPREAPHVDPRQRLLLELAWEALEDAGLPPGRLAGSLTGVYVGTTTSDYEKLLSRDPSRLDRYSGTGSCNSIAASRLSYFLDLRGPSLVVDTACSGSLLAVHLACQALRAGECQVALAGGVSVNLLPDADIFFSRADLLSPRGRCGAFGSGADGIVRSEGAGLVVLKPLSRALAEGDRVYAVIRGSAASQDGRSNGLMAPSGAAQEAVLRAAYAQAGIAPGRVQYVEAHGTGTRLGDPIEVHALGEVLGEGRPAGRPCALGSVKSNLGHTEAAAGVAGLIKAALAVHHRLLPPSLHCGEMNPLIERPGFPLRVPQALEPWPVPDDALVAGVSSFSFGGTNVHVVLEEAPRAAAAAPPALRSAWLLPLSARSPGALREMAGRYAEWLAGEGAEAAPDDLCHTASARRSHHPHRLALAFRTRGELRAQLDAFARGAELPPGCALSALPASRPPRLVFVFAGQGSAWVGMGLALHAAEPVFRDALDACAALMRRHVEWSLLEELGADEAHSRLRQAGVAQPAGFAVQVALAALWRSWGVEPQAVVGQSMGEVAAAHVAGALSLDDAVRVVCERAALLQTTAGKGATAVVGLPAARVEEILLRFGGRLGLAGATAPATSVVSGDPQALVELLGSLAGRDVFCRIVEGVDVAAHSPQMEPLRAPLRRALDGLRPGAAAVPFFSAVAGGAVPGQALDAGYWERNLRDPFRFAEATRALLDGGYDAFVEVGPHPVLLGAIRQTALDAAREVATLGSQTRDGEAGLTLLASLGELYARGYPVEWSRLYPAGGRCLSLPAYPWQRERHWFDQLPADGGAVAGAPLLPGAHPLLGTHLSSSLGDGQRFWECELGALQPHFLGGHRVQGTAVLPSSGFLELALASVRRDGDAAAAIVEDVAFDRLLALPEEGTRRVQLALSPAGAGEARFRVSSRGAEADPAESWTPHASGTLRWGAPAPGPDAAPALELDAILARCPDAVPVAGFYEAMRARGLEYGPAFQGIVELWRGPGEALGRLRAPPAVAPEVGRYLLHPALLDAALQVMAAADDAPAGTVYLPSGVRRWRLLAAAQVPEWSHARLAAESLPGSDRLEADVRLFSAGGRLLAVAEGFRVQRLDTAVRPRAADPDAVLHETRWDPAPAAPVAPGGGEWLILADGGGVGDALARRLEERGARCTLVHAVPKHGSGDDGSRWLDPAAPGSFDALFRGLGPRAGSTIRGVVHLWGLDAPTADDMEPAALEWAQARGAASVPPLLQAWTRAGIPYSSRLWLVTRGARAVAGESVAVGQCAMPGVGQVVALEHSESWGGAIDLDPAVGDAEQAAAELLPALLAGGEEKQQALRGGERLVPRLAVMPRPAGEARPPRLRADGTYLVTGGLTGLGLETARWMVANGARRLLLVGRTPLPPRALWRTLPPEHPAAARVEAVRALEAMGVSVHPVSADVGDEAALAAVLEAHDREGWPPIRGVVHAAGLAEAQLLLNVDGDAWRRVTRPKVAGAWNLHRLTRSAPLDFFVLFSSIAGVLGQYGQSSYAAGNAFLDGLALFRRACGLPALSVAWGPWAGVGMLARAEAAGAGLGRQAGLAGIEEMAPEECLECLGRLLSRGAAQATVVRADWPCTLPQPLTAHLAAAGREGPVPAADGDAAQAVLLELLLAGPAERGALLRDELRRMAARVLGLAPGRLDPNTPLPALGMDSIMAVELKNAAEATLPVKLAIVDLFTCSIAQLAGRAVDQLGAGEDVGDVLAEVERLSLDEARLLLPDGAAAAQGAA